MGIADSPLKDRVVFVMGSPRSGTTWLASVLAVHPEIAGILSESHLFDIGVERLFRNLESQRDDQSFLSSYVSRAQLTDLVRDLSDGVLLRMQERVKPSARLVMEKTPVGINAPDHHVATKLECYPDAWYLHIVRDEASVVESYNRMPWTQEMEPRDRASVWQRSVGAIRGELEGHPRYRELPYEEFLADPRGQIAEVFRWLDVEAGEDVLDRVTAVSREHHAPHRKPAARTRVSLGRAAIERRLRAVGRQLLRRDPAENGRLAPVADFLGALGGADADGLRALTSDSFELKLRSATGDLQVRGEQAHEALARIAGTLFAQDGFLSQSWAVSHDQLYGVWFSGIKGDASRVDISLALALEGDRIRSATLISGGELGGRMPREWTAPPEPWANGD